MFITKEELKKVDINKAFKEGNNFIKITNGRHTIFKPNGNYKVVNHKNGLGLTPVKKIPKYIQEVL